jgi:hypothetical protein
MARRLSRGDRNSGGRGALSLDLGPSMFGTLEVRAYQITSDADPISDERLVYVDPADDLKSSIGGTRELQAG